MGIAAVMSGGLAAALPGNTTDKMAYQGGAPTACPYGVRDGPGLAKWLGLRYGISV